jgi:hypothetical protein
MLRVAAALALLFFCAAASAQQPPLLMTPGQQQFVSTNACGLNAYSSSDPLVVSVHQVSPNGYQFEALKPGTATITHNCGGQFASYTLSVQGAEYKTYVCPAEVSSAYAAPEGWSVEQKQRRVFSFTRASIERDRFSCVYGAGDDVILSRKLSGRCSLSPNKKSAYCQP